jgi:hypothetical protein
LLSRRRLIGGGYLGFALFLISSFMNKFRKLGFIEYNNQLKVHNSLLNVILHDAPGLRRDAEDA